MWTCPRCNRNFKYTNMSHMCSTKDMGELFVDKPDELVLAFDAIIEGTSHWEPNTVGASINTIVFTSQKAWLIVKPMTKEHHIRLKSVEEVDAEVFRLLKMGHEYSLN